MYKSVEKNEKTPADTVLNFLSKYFPTLLALVFPMLGTKLLKTSRFFALSPLAMHGVKLGERDKSLPRPDVKL
ncbi:MAG: hypothetical protein Fur0011_3670 [Candidatus Microgenomates bacterium]